MNGGLVGMSHPRSHWGGCTVLRRLCFYGLSAIAIGLGSSIGCGYLFLLGGDCSGILIVDGTVLDANTLGGATDVALGIEAFGSGASTIFIQPILLNGTLSFRPPAEDGTFQIGFGDFGQCNPPVPDRIDMIVARGGCEQRFTIEINSDTVVDPTAPDDVLELKDPILVPPCPTSP